MDTGTGLAVLGVAKLLEKLLGPTAEYVGDGIKNWTEKRVNNVKRIFSIAFERLGEEIHEPGEIPPRVLKGILEDGSFIDDELGAHYFGGVLAASRTTNKQDDRGASFIALLTKLSSYQIRLHYVLYSILKKQFNEEYLNVSSDKDRHNLRMHIALKDLKRSMVVTQSEFNNILTHSSFGIHREALIDHFFYGTPKNIRDQYSHIKNININVDSFIFTPSSFGVELFLWVHGMGGVDVNKFFQTEISSFKLNEIRSPQNFGTFP
jgi:hypothetical protein